MRRSKPAITALRPAGVRATPPARRMKSLGATSPLLTNVKTTESAINGRNSSARSRASEGRPYRGWWKNPSIGSKPVAYRATVNSLTSNA